MRFASWPFEVVMLCVFEVLERWYVNQSLQEEKERKRTERVSERVKCGE